MKNLFLNSKFILFLILVNTILIFINGYCSDEPQFLINVFDNLITSLFIVEVLIKLRAYGYRQYFSSRWNTFDIILIIISIPSLLIFLFDIQLFDVSFILSFRVLRLFKSFRFFKFIPNIEHLFNGLQRALKSSLFILISFGIYIFMISVISTELFKTVSPNEFCNPTVSLYTIFKLLTLEGWYNISENISSNYSGMIGGLINLYFIVILLSGGIFGLSLINAIFVDAMVSDNNDVLEKKVDELTEKINQLLEQKK